MLLFSKAEWKRLYENTKSIPAYWSFNYFNNILFRDRLQMGGKNALQ